MMALWCLGFAAANLVFETTGHFAGGPFAHYASGLSVADWLFAALKVVGAVVALLSIAPRPRLISPAVVTVLAWAAFATLAVYVLGSVAEAIGMGLGLIGYGVLATSYSRRHPHGKRLVILGVLCAPVVLGSLLLGIPALLAAFGLLPGP